MPIWACSLVCVLIWGFSNLDEKVINRRRIWNTKQPVCNKLSPILWESIFLRGEMCRKLQVRNLQKFACKALGHNCLGGIVLRMEGFYICLVLTDSFLEDTAIKMKTFAVDRIWGCVKQPGVSSKKKGMDSWSILLQKFPAALMRRSTTHLLQGGKLPPIRCIIRKG